MIAASQHVPTHPHRALGFGAALRTWGRVMGAIVVREIDDALGRGGYRLVLGILEPLFALTVAVIWHTLLRIQPAYGVSKVVFISTGLYSTFLFTHLSSDFRHVSKGSAALRRFPIEKTVDFVLAATFVKFAVYAFAGILGFGVIYFFINHQAMPHDWVQMLLGVLALGMLGVGMGLCNATLEQLIPLWRFIWIPCARGLILFSGVIYVPDFLPVHVRYALSWNPVLQGVEQFRHGFYPGYPNACTWPAYMWSFACGLILVGLCANRVFRRQLDDI
jgi:capsular polysaccharide transport system permease protein